MNDDARTRRELVAELEELRKRLAMLEASQDAELVRDRDAMLLAQGEAAREDRARLHRLSAQGTDLICEIGVDGTVLWVSDNAEAILGRPAETLFGSSALADVGLGSVHPDDGEALKASFDARIGIEREIERVYRYRVDGTWRWLASRGRAAIGPDGVWRAVIYTRDVTDREEALEALRRSEARYRVLIETTHDLVAELDAEGRVLFVSPSCREVLGLRPEEMVGTTPFSLIHPDDVENLAERFLGRVTSSRVSGDGAVFRVQHRDGSWRWLEGTGTNFETADGETHVVAVTRDVTRRIEAERAREGLMRRMEQARRFESLGVLATGMAHDFNNLLTPILGAAGLALMDLPASSPIRPRLERIQRASSEAAALTHRLLEYAGMGGLDAAPVDLPTVVSEIEDVLRGTVAGHARLRVEHDAAPPRLEADSAQLSQLVVQLVSNAVDAIAEAGGASGSVTLRTGSGTLDEDSLARLYLGEDCRAGRYAWLEVEDDGAGMDDAARSRVFDPFFTTKLSGRGLGLSLVLGVVRKHRGAVELRTERGGGTRIRVWLPVDPGA